MLTMNVFMIATILAQGLLKALLGRFLIMFFELQMLAYLISYEFIYPANAQVYNEYLRSFVEFKLLKPAILIKYVFPNFSVEELSEKLEDFNTPIILASLLVVTSFILGLLVLIPFTRKFGKKKFKELKKKFIFNGLIRSVQLSFIKQCLILEQYCKFKF